MKIYYQYAGYKVLTPTKGDLINEITASAPINNNSIWLIDGVVQ